MCLFAHEGFLDPSSTDLTLLLFRRGEPVKGLFTQAPSFRATMLLPILGAILILQIHLVQNHILLLPINHLLDEPGKPSYHSPQHPRHSQRSENTARRVQRQRDEILLGELEVFGCEQVLIR